MRWWSGWPLLRYHLMSLRNNCPSGAGVRPACRHAADDHKCNRRAGHVERHHSPYDHDLARSLRAGQSGKSPEALTWLGPRTGMPLLATALGVAAILVLALAVPLSGLADLAARFTLVVYAIVNAALLRIKWQEAAPPVKAFVCPRWVPAAGLISSLGLLVLDQAVR